MDYTLNNQPKSNKTEVIIGEDALEQLGRFSGSYTKTAIISDESAAKYCLGPVQDALGRKVEKIILPDGEANKNLRFAEDILRQLREAGFDRKSLIIGLGGGVINDIVGFAASMYMRGVDWLVLPTTLIAQADASIGGKTGVNLGGYKNMVGSFWPPKAVLINPKFLKTLPLRQIRNGLAEIIKMGFIADAEILDEVQKIEPEKILGVHLNKASELAAKAKIEIVNSDMYESGGRKLLNFGHTIGHALESISLETDEPLLHGEAISIGMAAEAKLAELEDVCKPELVENIKETLTRFGLPTSYKHAVIGDILERILADKKNVGKDINWTLPKAAGEGLYNHLADDINIKEAIKSVII